MIQDKDSGNGTQTAGIRRYVPLLVFVIAFLVLLVIPLKVISYGYLPQDDALRHAAKSVSGKPWSEILILGDTYKIDHNFGWHVFLRQIYLLLQCDAEGIVVFSVIFLFALFGWSALPWLKRPEAWLGSLLLIGTVTALPDRAMYGRPFALTMALLVSVLFLWQIRSPAPPNLKTMAGICGLITIGVFIHGGWYFWALPLAAFFLAGEYRWGFAFLTGCTAGIALGAACTGHPLDYVYGAILVAVKAFGMHQIQRTMVTEYQPMAINPFILLVLGGLLITRHLTRLNARPLTKTPAFWLVCLGLVLGLKAERFWDDWGAPALAVLVACDLQTLLQAQMPSDSFKRIALTGGLALAMYLAFTADIRSRWTYNLSVHYLTQDDPQVQGWLPDKGGIFYSADIALFYKTFFKNPKAEWRYMLGFESTLMPDEDFKTARNIWWNFGDSEAYQPWVEKMRPEDRLAIPGERSSQPKLPQLEWNYAVSGVWLGRLPQTNTAIAPAIPGAVPR